jgi:hypothetical protein
LAGVLFYPGKRADTLVADQVIKVIFSGEARR